MKLITWNCQGGFRNKFNAILTHLPDILVVQECEHLDKLLSFTNDKAIDFLWFGHNKNKGVGVFSFGNYRFKLLKEYNPDFKTIVPILVSDEQTDFILYAICANNPSDKNNQYIEQVWKAINYYDELLQNNIPTILIGDFNSNKIWDIKRRMGNHSDVVSFLEKREIESSYHHHFAEEQGNETQPTFYLYRHQNKPYHIDYCFASKEFINKLESISIGKYEEWISLSDHMPVIAVFK